jgi:hypothetical protein
VPVLLFYLSLLFLSSVVAVVVERKELIMMMLDLVNLINSFQKIAMDMIEDKSLNERNKVEKY